jgi:hypothetical protein
VPYRVQKAFLKCIFENCKESSRFCYRHFAPPQAKDLSGSYRRAKIEDDFPGIAALFSKQVSVKPQMYEHNTGYYGEVTCGLVKMTQSCISDPDEVPRLAKFRSTLAQNGQLSLFSSDEEADTNGEISKPRYLYCILSYGIDPNSPKRSWPAFVRVQFPDEKCAKYLDDGIDLFARFPEIVSEYIPKPTFARQPAKRRRKKKEQA